MNESMNVIYTAADGNYALQAQVLLLSLVKTQKSRTRLIVFGNGWSVREANRLQSISNSTVDVELKSIDLTKFADIKLTNKFPLATAYNVLAPKYLLAGETRALYVDADVVVTTDLSYLWSIDLVTPVGAVLDAHIGWVSSPSMWRPWREEGLHPMAPYLNTGVMLIDVLKWNEMNLTEKVLDLLTRYELPCVDQDALNLALRGGFDQLPPRFNSMPYHYMWKFRYIDAVESDSEIGLAIREPAIIHFHRSFLGKPWTYGAIHPATQLWRVLAGEAHPGWRKSTDFSGLVRRKAARFAKMLEIDSRACDINKL